MRVERIPTLSDNYTYLIIDPDSNVSLDQVGFESNSRLFGTIYAPNAAIEIQSDFELFGAIMARRLHLSSWSRVHYDEALRSTGANGRRVFQTLCWRELALPTGDGQPYYGEEYEYPSIKAIDEVGLVEREDAPGVFTNADWNDEWLEVTCSDVWGLFLSFPHVTEAYL